MNRAPRKSAAQWAELVSEYDAGSESEREFCQRHDIKLAGLRKWRYHFESPKQKRGNQSTAAFAKVNVTAPRSAQDAAVLHIGADIRLQCPASYNVSMLAQLALEVHRGR